MSEIMLSAVNTRQKIMNAALLVTAKDGFEKATTNRISRTAGVSEGIIYHYFKNKYDLCHNMIKEGAEEFRRCLMKEIDKYADPKEKLNKLIDFHFEYFTGKSSIFKVIFGRGADTSIMMENILKIAIIPYSRIIETLIKQGIKEGEFKNLCPRITALNLLGMMQLPAIALHFESEKFSAHAARENVKNIFIGGLLR
ncbi:MAG: TetR/AcrR family transcriptional regulator [Candidatus Omnitrophota bacterium]